MATYAARSREPAHALWFLLPPMMAYLYWAVALAPRGGGKLLAHTLVQDLLKEIGFTWAFMPGLTIVIVLFAIHFTTHNPFDPQKRQGFVVLPDLRLYPIMLGECLLWAMPIFLVGSLIMSYLAGPVPQMAPLMAGPLVGGIMLSLGAGIFEELVFRLIGLNMLDLVLAPFLDKQGKTSRLIAIVLTSLAFAAAHFVSPNNEFTVGKAVFYYFGGVYFSVIFIWRGFGIAAGTHALFDVLVTLIIASKS